MASVTSNSVAGVIDAQLIAYNDNVTRLAVSSGNKIQLLIKSDDLQTWQTSTEWQAAGASRMTEVQNRSYTC